MDSLMDIYGSCSTAEPFTRGGKKNKKNPKNPKKPHLCYSIDDKSRPFHCHLKEEGKKKKKAEHVWFVRDYDTFALTFLGERFWFDS